MTDFETIDSTQSSAKTLPKGGTAINSKRIGVRDFAGTFSTSLVIQACTVLQGIIVARLLGPVGKGELAAIILWPTMFAAFGVAGIYIALGKISAKVDEYDSIVRSAILLAIITSAISSIVCYISIPWLIPEGESHLIPLARLFIIVIPLNRLIRNLIAVDQGCANFKHFNLIRATTNPVYIAILLCFWVVGIRSVGWFIIGLLVGHLAAVLLWVAIKVKRQNNLFVGKLFPILKILKQSITFSLAGVFQLLYLHVDKILMLWLLGTRNLGLYTVALSASAVMGSITSSAGMVSFTIAAQNDEGKGFEQLAKTFRISVLLWMIFGGILAAIMSLALPLVFGHDFAEAINPARMLIIGSAFAGLANMLEQAVRGQGKAFIGLEGRLAGLILMTISGIVLAKTLGLAGICLAYIIGQFACLAVLMWRTNHHYSVKTVRPYLPQFNDINYLYHLCSKRFINYIKR
ncbi:MAG: lipopolysaccharide biosynthesis protein [Planctomycetota bacterium]|jgi:O-antigen/teichoic acid export membrane protein